MYGWIEHKPGMWENVSQMLGPLPPSLAAPSTCKSNRNLSKWIKRNLLQNIVDIILKVLRIDGVKEQLGKQMWRRRTWNLLETWFCLSWKNKNKNLLQWSGRGHTVQEANGRCRGCMNLDIEFLSCYFLALFWYASVMQRAFCGGYKEFLLKQREGNVTSIKIRTSSPHLRFGLSRPCAFTAIEFLWG